MQTGIASERAGQPEAQAVDRESPDSRWGTLTNTAPVTPAMAAVTGPARAGSLADQNAACIQAVRDRARDAETALEHLYERHSPVVYGALVGLLGDGERAESVLVETFTRFWQQPHAAPRDGVTLCRWLMLQAHILARPLLTPATTPRTSPSVRPIPAGLGPAAVLASDPAVGGTSETACLEDVLITAELARRPARAPYLQAENDAFFTVARRLATRAGTDAVLETLVHTAVRLCGAGTAGISLLETPDRSEEAQAAQGTDRCDAVFRWTHMAGQMAASTGGTTPRDFSPCGITLDRAAPQLFSRPDRYFTYLANETAPIVEGLVIPLAAADGPDAPQIGTIWIVSHDEDRHFDWEDARIMTSLASFTAIALQIAAADPV